MATKNKRKRKTASHNLKFINYSPAEASGQAVAFRAHLAASKANIDSLVINSEQEEAINNIYNTKVNQEYTYEQSNQESQTLAASFLASVRLDLDSREALGNRWSVCWSKESGRGEGQARRVLYQW